MPLCPRNEKSQGCSIYVDKKRQSAGAEWQRKEEFGILLLCLVLAPLSPIMQKSHHAIKRKNPSPPRSHIHAVKPPPRKKEEGVSVAPKDGKKMDLIFMKKTAVL